MKYAVHYTWVEVDDKRYSWDDVVEAESEKEALDKTIAICKDMCRKGFVKEYNIGGVEEFHDAVKGE